MTHIANRSPGREQNPDSIFGWTGIAALAIGLLASGCAWNAGQADGTGASAVQAAPGERDGPAAKVLPTPEKKADGMRAASPASLPGWEEDTMAGLRSALDGQCALRRKPPAWPSLCAEIAKIPRDTPAALRHWVASRFVAQALTAGDGTATGLVTGYHEPELQGSRRRSDRFKVPLHRLPAKGDPAAHASRAAIERARMLDGHELVWLQDAADAFFLHVQGSGRIRLDDGTLMRVGYAGSNGQRYKAIGAVLVARGALVAGDVDAHKIKAWLRAHPDEAVGVMHANPRYVFFRELADIPQMLGPPGALGVPLTPMRSVAVDPGRVPSGALLWLDTTHPVDGSPIRRLVVAQDTGAAITGPVRADLFWGTGPAAELGAGLMKQPGRLWVLAPTLPGR